MEVGEAVIKSDSNSAPGQSTVIEPVNRFAKRQDGAAVAFQTFHARGKVRLRKKKIAVPGALITIRNAVVTKD
jgi:hypothetical protein